MRIKGLDYLRAIAVLMVIVRHSEIRNVFFDVGWLGVDLFFVLSGFLVSGLLFSEYKKKGYIRIKRFLIRRAFKIAPPFYFFLLVTFIIQLFSGKVSPFIDYLGEIFYLQSYAPHIWMHTWSLSVEEQFYISLAVILYFAIKNRLLDNRKHVIIFFITILTISFVMRVLASYPHINQYYTFTKTHLRLDGIVIGVFISYLYHFTNFYQFFQKHRIYFPALAIILVLPAFLFKGGSFNINTYGFTLINLGFAIFVLLSLQNKEHKKLIQIPLNVLAFIGVHSYSIYLWHLPVHQFLQGKIKNFYLHFIIFVILSVAIGAFFSISLEKPFLRLRDKIKP